MEEHGVVLFSLEEQLYSTDLQVKTGSLGRLLGSDVGKVKRRNPADSL